jgi:hypothetical protein
MGNSRGTGPATSASPDSLASDTGSRPSRPDTAPGEATLDLEPDNAGEFEAAEREIEADFRRRIAGLRRMPRRDRPYALRAAREQRQLALIALHERRACDRHARFLRRRLLKPVPQG